MTPNPSRLETRQKEGEAFWYLCKDSWLFHEEENVPQTKKITLTSPLQKSLRLVPYPLPKPKYDFFQQAKMPHHWKES